MFTIGGNEMSINEVNDDKFMSPYKWNSCYFRKATDRMIYQLNNGYANISNDAIELFLSL